MVLTDYQQYYRYKTLQGDTFDSIALDFYNSEKYANIIMQANPKYVSTLVFDAEVELIIPIIQEETTSTLPPWKQGEGS